MDLNTYRDEAHAANLKWWQDIETGEPIERDPAELVALIHSELSEALEAERKDLMDDKLPHRKGGEVEMADAVIRLLDFAGGFRLTLNYLRSVHTVCAPDLTEWGCNWNEVNDTAANSKAAYITLIHRKVSEFYTAIETDLKMNQRHGKMIAMIIEGIADYCKTYGYDLEAAYREKMAFNATRHDHTHEARKMAGGKKF